MFRSLRIVLLPTLVLAFVPPYDGSLLYKLPVVAAATRLTAVATKSATRKISKASTKTRDSKASTKTKASKTSKRKKKSTTTTTTVKKNTTDPPLYWTDSRDDIVWKNETNSSNYLSFTIRGTPRPLRRHRTSRGFVYNPSALAQKDFGNATLQLLNSTTALDCNSCNVVFHSTDTPLTMSLVFWMPRPQSHYTAQRPGPHRLRAQYNDTINAVRVRTDVDNLAKFVLDSLQGILYHDDHQIVALQLLKVYGAYSQGAVQVTVQEWNDNHHQQTVLAAPEWTWVE